MKKRADFPTALAWWMYKNQLTGEAAAARCRVDRAVISKAKRGLHVGAGDAEKIRRVIRGERSRG